MRGKRRSYIEILNENVELRKNLTRLNSTPYHKAYQAYAKGDPDHEHSFDEWELISDSGIVFCIWKCECGLEINQLLGERLAPESVPKDRNEWSE